MKVFSQYSTGEPANVQSMIFSGLRLIPNGKIVRISNAGEKTLADEYGNTVASGAYLEVPDGGYFHFGVEKFRVAMS